MTTAALTMTVATRALSEPASERLPITRDQQIAGHRIGVAAGRIRTITERPSMTPEARDQARLLRREVESLCAELRRRGL